MTYYRINKQSRFTQIDNRMIDDDQITAKAKGILLYLLSKPDGWKIYEVDIINRMKDGRDSIRSGLKELVENGYINRTQSTSKDGKFSGYNYEVYEYKLDNPNYTNRDGKTDNGYSDNGKTDNGKPPTSNTNLINTKSSNTLKPIVEPKATTIKPNDAIIKEVFDHLNKMTGKRFKASTQSNYSKVNARLNEGYTLSDIKYVIDNKCKQWLHDNHMNNFLRPSTLFAPNNFESYINEPPYVPKQKSISNMQAAANIMQLAQDEERRITNEQKRYIESNGDDKGLLPW